MLVLGGMAELGEDSLSEHRAIAELIGQYKWKAVILVGGDFLKIKHPFVSCRDTEEAKQWLRQQHFENTHLLIKGSRSMQMEKVLDN